MKVINPRPKPAQDKYRKQRTKHLLDQICLYANSARIAPTAQRRDSELAYIILCIKEIHSGMHMNDHKRRQLFELIRTNSLCDTPDLHLDKQRISINAPIDIDIDALAQHVIW